MMCCATRCTAPYAAPRSLSFCTNLIALATSSSASVPVSEQQLQSPEMPTLKLAIALVNVVTGYEYILCYAWLLTHFTSSLLLLR
jgi:hypothetical protein